MNNLTQILQKEQQRHHKLDDPDLLTFATLSQIAHEEAQAMIKRRFWIGSLICIVGSLLILQMMAFDGQSFNYLITGLSDLMTDNPVYLILTNSALALAILAVRRVR